MLQEPTPQYEPLSTLPSAQTVASHPYLVVLALTIQHDPLPIVKSSLAFVQQQSAPDSPKQDTQTTRMSSTDTETARIVIE
ncbi:GM22776 [Drosophila sechellia]|uniref:GM22776 n=1 Tax=Drosophila sechellia TaxID=7238 RepID=B4I6Z8_DROSE|nr:GM22776 [Drosophila sechellia]